jgi:hypothetical protein
VIEIYNKITGEMQTVESWPTATAHFVITRPLPSTDPEIDTSDLFVVTHKRSTAIALGPFKDEQIARVCAAVMGSLPMPWDDFSMAVSDQYRKPDPMQAKRFGEAWKKLPPEIHKWRREVSDACMCGDL